MTIGTIRLEQGPQTLRVEATKKPGAEVMELRTVCLRRID